ncbi:UNVERIFIED_CONTAM: hypothetical protein PYX00_005964 [Menopon gallinae]|uniref:Bifunctional lysine-specific demethylase and histidyl-hydroxylase n=1 Tax=Menopon gallinae TaxID=328185 RepID=A0AAW2HVA6_9NEOP
METSPDSTGSEAVKNKIPKKLLRSPEARFNSIKAGKACFSKLISPIKISTFFKTIWEKKPLCVTRNNYSYYENVCSMLDFKKALAEKDVYFGENIDVTTYINGVKACENHVGRANPKKVMDLYKKGRSIRLLNPQTFIKNVRCFTTQLQEYFRCFVGANIYLTPGNSQGFAPHYDDVEAFVLQLSGRKEWRIYNPRPNEDLVRFSSHNFVDADIGQPILKVILEPGDLLYFPRGVIHQAQALEEGSMHITVSCYQRNSYADFLEMLLPVALQTAISEDVQYRKGLPKNYLDHLGMVASDTKTKQRRQIISHIKKLVNKLTDHLPIDSCADQFGKKFIHDALPPIIGKGEDLFISFFFLLISNEKSTESYRPSTVLQITIPKYYFFLRLVCEDEKFKLYYNTKNGLVYHEVGHKSIKIPETWAMMSEILLKNYPNFTDFGVLLDSVGNADDVIEFVEELCKRRLLLFDKPLREE